MDFLMNESRTARMKKAVRIAVLALAIAGVLPAFQSTGLGKKAHMAVQETGRVRAPEITGGRGWLNTAKPLSLAALRGKVVLLDFWTYGCINCIHIIPDLKKLEAKYANQLVVIGIHSAKFENEKQTENIRRIIVRYELEHPVYNDAEFAVWQSYGVRAWPTQVLIDPAGYVVGTASGEGNYDLIDKVVGKLVDEFRKKGQLNEEPLKFALERAAVGDLPLAFPGKVLADSAGKRLFIADSNHNRIVVTTLDGNLIKTFGTGERGAQDGPFDKATFYRPQGMALDGDSLYVADTENHLIRQIDLKTFSVKTIAGTGQQMREYFQKGPAQTIALSSPWDLQLVGRTLYIAMAGPHQIWQLDLDKNEVSTFAGSGREQRKDGSLAEAGFAQPSGLAASNSTLYVADSEANIIRAIDLQSRQVKTLAGGDLFEFGDVDGKGNDVRLQHPLGLFSFGDSVLIADTYNHKIKQLNPGQQTVKTFLGTGKPGQHDGPSPSFYEPAGLSVADNKLYVADTNNHAIRVVDLATKAVSTLRIKGLEPPASLPVSTSDASPNLESIKIPKQTLRAGSDGAIVVNVDLPDGYHLNPAAPQRFKASIQNGGEHVVFQSDKNQPVNELAETSRSIRLPLRLPVRALVPGRSDVRIQLTLFYCREDNTGTCRIKTLVWSGPVEVVSEAAAQTEIKLEARLPAD
jgi:DNA-binding beta-propeller fold protein YncE